MEHNNLQPNNTYNASFAPNTAAAANQQQGAQPQAELIPPLANAPGLHAHPPARNLQEYNIIRPIEDGIDPWNLPEYQPIQPEELGMEKLADEAANTVRMEMLLKHAQEYKKLGELQGAEGELRELQHAEGEYEKALKHTENVEHYKLYAGCLREIYLKLSQVPLTPDKDEAKERTYKEKAARAFYYLGDLYQKQEAWKEAQTAYKAACELALYTIPLQALVEVTRQLGDSTDIAAALEKLADFYVEKKEIALAIEKLKEAFEVGKSAKILEKLEVLYRQVGGEDALEELADFYAEQKETALAIEKLKEVFELGKAARILEKLEVLYRQVGGEDALEKLADFYAEQKEIALAIERLKEVFETRKSFAILDKLEALYGQIGGENSQSKMHEIAIQRFELQISQDPKNISLYRQYVWFLKDIGKRNEARAVKKRIDELLQQKLVKQKKQIEFLNRQFIHLNFSHWPAIQDADLISFLKKNRCQNLQELNLTRCQGVTEAGLKKIVKNATQLKRLTLDYCPGTTIKLLHKLNAKGIAFSIEGVAFKENVLDLSERKDLKDEDSLTDEDLLKALQENHEITQLDLTNCKNITDAGLAHIKHFQWLKSLKLHDCKKITDEGLSHLTGLSQLTLLYLRGSVEITDEGLRLHLTSLSKLKELSLSACDKITDKGLEQLAKLSQLKTLHLRWCKITDKGLEQLAKLSQLERLYLRDCNEITDEGLNQLAKLTQLTTLELSYCSWLSNEKLGKLSGLTQLTWLKLTGCNNLTDAGLQDQLAGLTQLTSLGLYGCNKITNTGLQYLVGLTQLTSLNLGGCIQLTDEGLQQLADLTKLKTLDLQGCTKITVEAKEELKRQIPGLTITE